jgi:hypothetical protein
MANDGILFATFGRAVRSRLRRAEPSDKLDLALSKKSCCVYSRKQAVLRDLSHYAGRLREGPLKSAPNETANK